MIDPATLRPAFRDAFGDDGAAGPLRAAFAPGRINLIGEHLDYNGGPVLPAAIRRGLTGLWRRRGDARVRIRSRGRGMAEFALPPEPPADWWGLAAAVFAILRREGLPLPGLDLYVASDLPGGSGLSSSAAFAVLCGWIGCLAGEVGPEPMQVARWAQRAETEHRGVRCGLMDPFASAQGREGCVLRLNCADETWRTVPWNLPDHVPVALDSGIRRELAESAYNERRRSCEAAADELGVTFLAELRDPARVESLEDPVLRRRARHVVTECRRVGEAVDALERGDAGRLGALLTASHRSLRKDFEVSLPDLDTLVDLAEGHPACAGARLTGAGFGGCAVALVRREERTAFGGKVDSAYRAATGRRAAFLDADPGPGAAEMHV